MAIRYTFKKKKIGEKTGYEILSMGEGGYTSLFFTNKMAAHSHYSSGDVAGIFHTMADLLAYYLVKGTVHIDKLGTFKLRLASKTVAADESQLTPQNIKISGVTFIPSKYLLNEMKGETFARCVSGRVNAYDQETRLSRIVAYLGEFTHCSSAQVVALNSCGRTTAYKDLKHLLLQGRIRLCGRSEYFLQE